MGLVDEQQQKPLNIILMESFDFMSHSDAFVNALEQKSKAAPTCDAKYT